jgi:predicted ester cyclase
MSIQENKVLIRQVFEEAVNQGNLAVVDVLFSPDFVDHSTPDQVPGPEGVKSYFASIRASFPDMYVTIDDLIVEGDKVVVRTTWRGAIYEGIAPTGKQVARTLIQIFRIEGGQILEEWNEGESLI